MAQIRFALLVIVALSAPADKQHHRGPWHYINWPFKPEGQPANLQTRQPDQVNILTALAENKIIVKKENDPERKAIALAWLFHLVGDVALSADTKSTGRFQVMARSAVDKMLPGV